VTDTRIDHFSEECACGCVCFRGVASEDRLHGADDVVRIASDGSAVLVEDVVPLSELFPWRSWIVPNVGVLGDDAQNAVTCAADQDRRMWLMFGLGLADGTLEPDGLPSKSNGSSSVHIRRMIARDSARSRTATPGETRGTP